VCLWSAGDRLLCSGDHLLKGILPPVTFERGFEVDPMGSYLDSLDIVRELAPELVLPGHGEVFADGAARAESIGRSKRRRLDQIRGLLDARPWTVADLTTQVFRQQLTSAQLHFAMAEVLAFLAYLEARAQAHRVTGADGGFVWRGGPASA
jgi:glyoxylase-like metal-dependent hydrolase (beta-lactamase superfamily II)